jgi:DNA-binding MarR family transcriptional regulator
MEVAMDARAVFDDLVRFETVLWNAVDARLAAEVDVSLGSFNVLLVVDATPACRVQDVAAALAITVGGASQSVDRLERRELCVRRPNPADRRSSIVELTPSGRELLERGGAVFDRELDRLLVAPLDRAALQQLGSTLAALRAAATTTPGEQQ